MMIDQQQAEQITLEHMNKKVNYDPDKEIVIMQERTIEKSYGWIFHISFKKYIETGDPDYVLAPGIGPIVVEKDGTLHNLGTGQPLSKLVEFFENWLKENRR